MIRAKKTKLLKFKTLYIKGFFPFLIPTPDIGEAKNYFPFAILVHLFCLIYHRVNLKVVNGVSISGHFDSRMEVETGGVKGLFNKLVLYILRRLEEIERKLS